MVDKDQTKQKSENKEEIDEKDFAKYISYQIATGGLPENFDVEKLSDEKRRELVTDYNKWVEEGRKKPKMQKSENKEEPKILRVYRRRVFNEEKLTAVVEGSGIQMGKEPVPIYAVIDGKEDKTNQIGTDTKYTIPYTEGKAKELVEKCKKESKSPKFYIKDESGPTFRVKIEANFYRPFDDVLNEALAGKTI